MAKNVTMVKILCHDGSEHVTEVENYNAGEIVKDINNPEIPVMAIGDVVLHTTSIKAISKA
jgi:hypothetical protein